MLRLLVSMTMFVLSPASLGLTSTLASIFDPLPEMAGFAFQLSVSPRCSGGMMISCGAMNIVVM